MRIIFATITALVLILTSASAQDTEQIDKEMKQAIESIIGSPIPGISVAVANGEGVIWSGTAGYSNIEERKSISQTHLFGIGSISNQFVAVVILQMAADKLIDLDDTPAAILGDVVSNIDNADSATVRQLLNHTSGIYSWADDASWARRGRGVQMNPKYRWAKDEVLKYITKDRHNATNKPGAAYAHSQSNYTILGLIIEKLSGGLIEDEVRNRILVPLDLKDTYYNGYEIAPFGQLVGSYHLATDTFISKVGINFNFDFGQDRLIDTSGASLSAEGMAGAIVSTPRDLARFAIALRSGKLISPDALKQISPQAEDGLVSLHSEILGYTADMRWLDNSDLVITSFINMGIANTGPSAASDHVNSYVEKILIPIAKKYAK